MFHVKHLLFFLYFDGKSTIFCLNRKIEIPYFELKNIMFHVKHLQKGSLNINNPLQSIGTITGKK